ncbi:unnamed protein product [Caenorhabditis angaria]|uniref:Potassium channel domain-containing protein n=1 Tax=Caenorhabditis angaria TaxID=860376 RepID=A0A9P1N898_9PELO|nr:unnamed protein product [Caenorhabditis angaria]
MTTEVSRVGRLRQSFRHKAQNVREDVQERLRRARKVPRWVRILRTIYYEYGLKHVCLITLLILYQFLGAGIFYFCEAGYDEDKENTWNLKIAENRTKFVEELIVPKLFNNTKYLFFLSQNQTEEVSTILHSLVSGYEKQLGIRYTDQKIKWDFWNAMLYAQTICTTIGYGHLYPSTVPGRLFTMIYAIFGIPLVLSILDDLGKLLTRCLKTPWWLLKCGCRRAFRYCTKQTLAEIKKLDDEDRRDLEIFDLPIPIAIFVVIAWIFICSATFCIWESDWDYFVAFYFFFISLSTIGLGDITPTQPKYLLMLFIYIIIGLSLVSMCINLIQAKLERTYEAGRVIETTILSAGGVMVEEKKVIRRGSSLGIFRSSSSAHSLSRRESANSKKHHQNKNIQTVLSFPATCGKSSGNDNNNESHISKTISQSSSKYRFLPRSLSIDDVMRMVDTEDGDILVLTDLIRDESTLSGTSCDETSSNSQIVVISKSFETTMTNPKMTVPTSHSDPVTSRPSTSSTISSSHHPQFSRRPPPVPESTLEQLEELEDRLALSHASTQLLGNTVHFRSRLSLIPEQIPSTVEEGSEPTSPLSPDENSEKHNQNKKFRFFRRK